MQSAEPSRLALAVLVGGILLGAAALATRASRRGPIPLMLMFLAVGMIAGSDGLGGLHFDDHVLAYKLGTVTLVLILFDGGLSTRFHHVRAHLPAAVVLATVGVLATAGLLATAARLMGLPWPEALLLAAIVSSTDAAAVFSVLRGTGINIDKRVSATIELESGLNDPMAVLLTTAMVAYAASGHVALATLAWHIPLQLGLGAALGVAIGVACHQALVRLPPTTAGLFPVVTAAAAAIAYGGTTLVGGSGFLAVYVCGLVLGTRRLPDRAGVLRVHDFLAWAGQVGLFLTLGLLVYPSRLGEVAVVSLAIAGVLVVIARPLAVAACLLPFRYPAREIVYVGWVGLRGAVPIVLATFPFLGGVPGAERLFNIVFFVVLVSVVIQAGSVGRATRLVGLAAPAPPPPRASIEIASMRTHDAEVACYHIDARAAVANVAIVDVPFPDSAAIMLVVRGEHLLPARPELVLQPGDHVYVFCKPEDEAAVALWFGQRIDS